MKTANTETFNIIRYRFQEFKKTKDIYSMNIESTTSYIV